LRGRCWRQTYRAVNKGLSHIMIGISGESQS
jgi:hypothetical protein